MSGGSVDRPTDGPHGESCNHADCPCYRAGLAFGAKPPGGALHRALAQLDIEAELVAVRAEADTLRTERDEFALAKEGQIGRLEARAQNAEAALGEATALLRTTVAALESLGANYDAAAAREWLASRLPGTPQPLAEETPNAH